MAELGIQLLGHPTVTVDGKLLDVDTRKAVALLAHLAVEGSQSRSVLAALLWPESDEERARSALRRTLSSLRHGLDGRWVVSENDVLALGTEGVRCDLWSFTDHLGAVRSHDHPDDGRCQACIDRLEAAVELAQGSFMAGFGVQGSAGFDDWMTTTQERLRRELGWALDTLVRAQVAAGQLDAAIPTVHRRLGLDPLHERAHRQLMLLEAWRGRRSEAIRQYRNCVAVLDRELGVAPVEQTRELYQAIVEDRAPAPPVSQQAPEAPTPFQPVARASTSPPRSDEPGLSDRELAFVGRERELERLLDAWHSGYDQGRALLIEGEPGIGKTRLVDELASALRAEDARVHAVRCHEGESGLAHAPIIELLRSVRAGVVDLERIPPEARREASRLLPELSEQAPPPPLDSPGARARFFEGVGRVLEQGCVGEPGGLLVIDDLHWADAASRELVAFLLRRLEHIRLRLAVCWRPEALQRDDVLRRVAADRADAGLATRVRLGRLDREAIARALASAGAWPDEERLERAEADTEGLPLLLADELAGPGGQPTTSGRRLRARLDRLSEVASQVLTAAAVIGRRFDLDLLLRAGGRSEAETVDGLDELLAAALVRETGAGAHPSYDFTHDRIRALAYERASLARRRVLHRRVADSLRAGAPDPVELGPTAGRIAHHEQLAGREQHAATAYRQAGDHARSLFANREALEHYHAALGLETEAPTPLHEAIGDLLTLTGDYPGALQAYQAAIALAPSERTAAVLEHKVAGVHLRRGDRAAAEAHLEPALATFDREDEVGLRARALADASLSALRARDPHEAASRAREALQLAEAADDATALAQVHNLLGMLAHRDGDTATARRHLTSSRDLAEQLDDPLARAAAHNNLGLVARSSGDLGTAIGELEEALACARQVGDRHREAAILNNLADAHHDAGAHEEARDRLTQAVTIFAQVGRADTPEAEIYKLVAW